LLGPAVQSSAFNAHPFKFSGSIHIVEQLFARTYGSS
jgi:hypothetical protein